MRNIAAKEHKERKKIKRIRRMERMGFGSRKDCGAAWPSLEENWEELNCHAGIIAQK